MSVVRLFETPPFTTARDLVRSVGADCAVAVDGNAYSVPWRLIGERFRFTADRSGPFTSGAACGRRSRPATPRKFLPTIDAESSAGDGSASLEHSPMSDIEIIREATMEPRTE